MVQEKNNRKKILDSEPPRELLSHRWSPCWNVSPSSAILPVGKRAWNRPLMAQHSWWLLRSLLHCLVLLKSINLSPKNQFVAGVTVIRICSFMLKAWQFHLKRIYQIGSPCDPRVELGTEAMSDKYFSTWNGKVAWSPWNCKIQEGPYQKVHGSGKEEDSSTYRLWIAVQSRGWGM